MFEGVKKVVNAGKDRDLALAECAKQKELISIMSSDIEEFTSAILKLESRNREAVLHIEALLNVVSAVRRSDLPTEYHAAVEFIKC